MSLDNIRKHIDEIDAELSALIKKRMECSLEIAKIKTAENLPVYHPEREKAILEKVEKEGGEFGSYIRNVYHSIMTVSRALQNDTIFSGGEFSKKISQMPEYSRYDKVICQGAEGAFSHAAANKMFPGLNVQFKTSFEDVFETVANDENAVGILPVENSAAGSVSTVYDLILKYNHYIVRATTLDVSQNLLTVADETAVKTVYSHPHALKQCERYIKQHNLKAVEFENTALAAKYVAELNDPTVAAIGSKSAAELYGLNIAVKSIQNESENMTRFIAVSKNPCIAEGSNKVSLALSTVHEKGALYSLLGRFAACNLNITKIESRPLGHGFEYKFYIDFDGNLKDEKTLNLMSSLESELSYFVFLGNYIDR